MLIIKYININIYYFYIYHLYGDWGLGIGDWGLGPIANPQSPIPNPHLKFKKFIFTISIFFYLI